MPKVPAIHAPWAPTFVVEDALHLHATSRVGNAQGAAGNQALRGWGPVGGPHQTPVRLVMGPLQNLHGLAPADGQLGAVACREVVDHHGQLAATRKLIAVQCVLRCPGGNRNCIRLAAAIALAIQILSIPGKQRNF